VDAAVTQRWSNGPVEGHVNWLKMLKRQMYGRAGVELLRARLLPEPVCTGKCLHQIEPEPSFIDGLRAVSKNSGFRAVWLLSAQPQKGRKHLFHYCQSASLGT
jgi:hypothetical protein